MLVSLDSSWVLKQTLSKELDKAQYDTVHMFFVSCNFECKTVGYNLTQYNSIRLKTVLFTGV